MIKHDCLELKKSVKTLSKHYSILGRPHVSGLDTDTGQRAGSWQAVVVLVKLWRSCYHIGLQGLLETTKHFSHLENIFLSYFLTFVSLKFKFSESAFRQTAMCSLRWIVDEWKICSCFNFGTSDGFNQPDSTLTYSILWIEWWDPVFLDNTYLFF